MVPARSEPGPNFVKFSLRNVVVTAKLVSKVVSDRDPDQKKSRSRSCPIMMQINGEIGGMKIFLDLIEV